MRERRVSVPSEAGYLPVLMRFLQEFWTETRLPPAQAASFELALEEVFLNVVLHGTPTGAAPAIEFTLTLLDEGLRMTIEDQGPLFDPLSLPSPDVAAALAERPVGGQGVHLVRQMMDTVSYQRIGARNRLTMTKRLTP